jgi:hypothetical protein
MRGCNYLALMRMHGPPSGRIRPFFIGLDMDRYIGSGKGILDGVLDFETDGMRILDCCCLFYLHMDIDLTAATAFPSTEFW